MTFDVRTWGRLAALAVVTVSVATRTACANPEDLTRIVATIREPSTAAFETAFGALSEDEQSEVIRILTTDMRAWDVLGRIPATSHALPTASDKQKNSALGLYHWFKAGPSKDALERLRFVSLADRPHIVKLSFERGFCKMREAVSDDRGLAWRTWVVSIVKFWDEAGRKPASGLQTAATCSEQIQIAVSADGGSDGITPLKEQPVLTMDVQQFPRYFDSRAGWEDFRRRVWESVEMLQADLRGEMAALPARLRVIEVATGTLGQNEFLERRTAAILHRARAQASLTPAIPAPGSR